MRDPETVADGIAGGAWSALREKAEAARVQMETGPKEWPGRPSRQRLELFLEATPDAVLALLDDLETLAAAIPRQRRG